ncbi:MAG: YraN family protein [Chloroflexota bacterium]|nr:YraN family protein [Chloroflexota bacterium]MDE2884076.1 YraN family protein [Chloroflexota bacterium]
MPSERSKLGLQGERIAAAHLESQGLVIETRNYRTRFGEIDLIARDGEGTVFVEVRTKRSSAYGTPEESLTPRKQARLVKAAQEYLAEHGLAGNSWRIDLVAITLQPDGPAHIVHIESAVESPDG